MTLRKNPFGIRWHDPFTMSVKYIVIYETYLMNYPLTRLRSGLCKTFKLFSTFTFNFQYCKMYLKAGFPTFTGIPNFRIFLVFWGVDCVNLILGPRTDQTLDFIEQWKEDKYTYVVINMMRQCNSVNYWRKGEVTIMCNMWQFQCCMLYSFKFNEALNFFHRESRFRK